MEIEKEEAELKVEESEDTKEEDKTEEKQEKEPEEKKEEKEEDVVEEKTEEPEKEEVKKEDEKEKEEEKEEEKKEEGEEEEKEEKKDEEKKFKLKVPKVPAFLRSKSKEREKQKEKVNNHHLPTYLIICASKKTFFLKELRRQQSQPPFHLAIRSKAPVIITNISWRVRVASYFGLGFCNQSTMVNEEARVVITSTNNRLG